MENNYYIKKIKYSIDKKFINFIVYLLSILSIIMFLISITDGITIRKIVGLMCYLGFITFYWLGFSVGTSLDIYKNIINIRRFFIFRSKINISDIISIRKNSTYSGLITEVIAIVKVGNKKIRKNLINKPGLSGDTYKEIFETILKINPNIKIDMSITSDKY